MQQTNTRPAWRSPRNLFFLGLGLLTLYRMAVLLQPHMVLFYDEAYYYHWSLSPDWGYYSKPPVVAWVIWLTTNLLGDTAFAIRVSSPLLYAASALLVYATANRLWTQLVGVAAGWVFITMPLMGYNSLFITTDAPLVFFWALTLWCFVRAWEQPDNLLLWLAVGVACGLGMLSKYTMALLPLGLFIFMLTRPHGRACLATPGPWIAAILAGFWFSGNLLWNFVNDFMAFRHTSEISGADSYGFYPLALLEFWGAQLVLFGLIWCGFMIWLAWSRKRFRAPLTRDFAESEGIAIALWSFAPLFGVISLQALLSHAYINWAAPVYVSASMLAGLLLVRALSTRGLFRLLAAGCALNLLLLSLVYHWPVLLDGMGVERSKRNDPYFRVLGWDRIGDQVAPLMQQYPDARLLSNSRKLLAAVGFYAMPGELRLAHWSDNPDYTADYYDQKFNLRDLDQAGQRYIWIGEQPLDSGIAGRFASVEPLAVFSEPIYSDLTHRAYLYLLEGYQP